MSVRWKSPVKVPQGEFRDMFEWYQSERYKEIVEQQNARKSKEASLSLE